MEPPLHVYTYSVYSVFLALSFAVTYRRDRSIREVYDERFVTERPVSGYKVYKLCFLLFIITFDLVVSHSKVCIHKHKQPIYIICWRKAKKYQTTRMILLIAYFCYHNPPIERCPEWIKEPVYSFRNACGTPSPPHLSHHFLLSPYVPILVGSVSTGSWSSGEEGSLRQARRWLQPRRVRIRRRSTLFSEWRRPTKLPWRSEGIPWWQPSFSRWTQSCSTFKEGENILGNFQKQL